MRPCFAHRLKTLKYAAVACVLFSIGGTAEAQLPKSGQLTVDPKQIALDYTQMEQTDMSVPGEPVPRITALVFAPDGRTRAAVYADGRFLLEFEDRFHAKPAKPLALSPGTTVKALAFSSNGKFLAAAIDSHILIWQVATGQQIADIAGRLAPVAVLAFSPDSKVLAGAGHPKDSRPGNPGDDVVLWDATGLSVATSAKPLRSLKEFSVLHRLGGSVTQIVWFADNLGLNCSLIAPDAPGVTIHRYVCRQIPPSP
jgi:hypothetical protein